MKSLLLLSCLIAVNAGVTKRKVNCDGPIINGVHFKKEELKTDIDRPYLLTSDYSINTIYFSYSVNPDDDSFKTAKINLNTKKFADIDGVTNGFTQSVDAKTHDVYIGGSDGIYKYDSETNKAHFYGANGSNIWIVYFKDVVYFAEYPAQFLYTLKDGEISRFKDLEDTKVDNFVIDDDDNVYFTNYTGLYSQKMGSKDAAYFEDTADVSIRGLTTDRNGNVYACLSNGIYFVNKEKHVLEKALEVHGAFGVAFDDKNNIVYANATSVVLLTPSQIQNCF